MSARTCSRSGVCAAQSFAGCRLLCDALHGWADHFCNVHSFFWIVAFMDDAHQLRNVVQVEWYADECRRDSGIHDFILGELGCAGVS